MSNSQNGFLEMHQSIINEIWYKDKDAKALMIHIVLNVDIDEPNIWKYQVPIQQIVGEMGLTTNQVRGAIDKLVAHGVITCEMSDNCFIFYVVDHKNFQIK